MVSFKNLQLIIVPLIFKKDSTITGAGTWKTLFFLFSKVDQKFCFPNSEEGSIATLQF